MEPAPDDMLPTTPYSFAPGQKFTVYESPSGPIAANGKGIVSTNGDIDVFGYDNGYMLIRYEISENRHRIGYIYGEDFGDMYSLPPLYDIWQYGRARVTEKTCLTDDPFLSQSSILTLHPGDTLITLYTLDDFLYVRIGTRPS
ncbi:MAG: hypothetical protein IIW81_03240, partial [Oscillospiraceae bacterium]|nr:hypothetical protein [Oscillospiraceae bacterium]